MGVRDLGYRGKESFLLPFEKIIVLPDWNCREDYGDLETLGEDILVNGFQENLKGYYSKEHDKFVITNGHRRYRAVELLREQGRGLDLLFPVTCEPKEKLEIELLVTQISCSNVLPFTEREKGLVMRKMLLRGATHSTIAQQTGFKVGQVEWMVCLATLPRQVFDLYKEGLLTKGIILSAVNHFQSYEGVGEMLIGIGEKIRRKKISSQVAVDLIKSAKKPEAVTTELESADFCGTAYTVQKAQRWGKRQMKQELVRLLSTSKPFVENGQTYRQIVISEDEFRNIAKFLELDMETVNGTE